MDSSIRPADYYDRRLPLSVRISPCGTMIAVDTSSFTPADEWMAYEIFLYSEKGLQRLSRTGKNRDMRWRPGSKELAFRSKRRSDFEMLGDQATEQNSLNTDSTQVWLYNLEQGGDPTQLTTHPTRVVGFDWSPSGDRLVFEAEEPAEVENGGDEPRVRMHTDDTSKESIESERRRYLYVFDTRTGEAERLDPAWSQSAYYQTWYQKMKPKWGPGGKIAFVANQTDEPELFDVYTISPDGTNLRVHTESDATHTDPEWSPDGKRLAFVRYYGERRYIPHEACVVDMANDGGIESVSADLDRGVHFVDWLNGETLVGQVSDEGRCAFYEFPLGEEPSVLFDPEEPTSIKWSGRHRPFDVRRDDGRILTTVLNPNYSGITELRLGETVNGRYVDRAKPIHRFNTNISEKVEMGTKKISFENPDGDQIDGILYTPPGYDHGSDTTYPLLVDIHRNPHAVDVPRFRFRHQYWTDQGYVILKVNFRGSLSYGRAFAEAIQGQYADAEVDDIASGVRAVLANESIDEQNVFAVGFVHGATCVVQLLAETDLFTAGVAQHGIYDYLALFGTDGRELRWRTVFGEPWECPGEYRDASPMYDADGVRDPLLLMTGEEDTTAPPSQSERLYAYLKGMDRDVKLVEYPELGCSAYYPPDITLDKFGEMESWFSMHGIDLQGGVNHE